MEPLHLLLACVREVIASDTEAQLDAAVSPKDSRWSKTHLSSTENAVKVRYMIYSSSSISEPEAQLGLCIHTSFSALSSLSGGWLSQAKEGLVLMLGLTLWDVPVSYAGIESALPLGPGSHARVPPGGLWNRWADRIFHSSASGEETFRNYEMKTHAMQFYTSLVTAKLPGAGTSQPDNIGAAAWINRGPDGECC